MLKVLKKIHGFLVDAALLPVRLYRRYLSRQKPYPTCRFTPTCSQYCIDAFKEWGIIIGFFMTVWRILRCNPYCKGGYDPVPTRNWGKKSKNGNKRIINKENQVDDKECDVNTVCNDTDIGGENNQQ